MFKDQLNFQEPLLTNLQGGNNITQCHNVSEVAA